MDISRLHRVLKIITLLQTRRHYSPEDLSGELGISKRTVYRDLNMLELAGIPFYYDRDKNGYAIHQTYWLPAINLSLEEALALVAMAEGSGRDSEVPMLEQASAAARKIESQLPLALRAAVGNLSQHVSVHRPPVARHDQIVPIYEAVRKAVAHRQTIRGTYISFHEKKQITVEIEPYWLIFFDRAWYVIGRSLTHKEVRTFKLGRFAAIEPLPARFAEPKQTLAQHLGNAWRFMPEGKEYDIKLEFCPLVAANVAEVRWHKTQQVTWQDDGSILYQARVDGLSEIYWWILGYGDQVKVLAPKPLATRIKQTAEKMAKIYE